MVDVYAPMFACEFVAFLILVFGYQAFGVRSGSLIVVVILVRNCNFWIKDKPKDGVVAPLVLFVDRSDA